MKLFVTGGTGFVGSHFIKAATEAGHQIIALRRSGSTSRIPLVQAPHWIEGDLTGEYAYALSECDCMVHFAAHTPNPPYGTFEQCFYWNVYASLKLAEQAKHAGIQKFLIAGSSFEYGSAAERYACIPPNAPLEPSLSYPASKAAASIAFSAFAKAYGLSVKILRIFQVYGEGESEGRLWPALRQAALAGEDLSLTAGEQLRDFVPVEDVAKSFVQALDFSDSLPGEPQIENIGSGEIQTVRDFASKCWQAWNAAGQLKFGALEYRANEIMRLCPG